MEEVEIGKSVWKLPWSSPEVVMATPWPGRWGKLSYRSVLEVESVGFVNGFNEKTKEREEFHMTLRVWAYVSRWMMVLLTKR